MHISMVKYQFKWYSHSDSIIIFFFCRRKDIGKPKATVAAEFINQRIAGCHCTPYLLKLIIFLSPSLIHFTSERSEERAKGAVAPLEVLIYF